MSQEELIADTNRLLQQLVASEKAQKEEAERSRAEFETKFGDLSAKREETLKSKLGQRGLPSDLIDTPEEDWEKRINEARQKSKENLELMRQKDEQYKEELMQELRIQSDLLKQIAEKLGA